MTGQNRSVLSLRISDPARFFSEFVRLAERESRVEIRVNRDVVPVSQFCNDLPIDFFRDVIDLKIYMDGDIVVSYHDSLEDCFAEESVRGMLDQLAALSLVSYTPWPLLET